MSNQRNEMIQVMITHFTQHIVSDQRDACQQCSMGLWKHEIVSSYGYVLVLFE